MLCSQCGAKADDTHTYCPHCGAKLNSSDSTPPEPSSTPPRVKRKPMPFWFKLLAFLAVLALVGVTAGILLTESWVDVVDKQLEALRQDDIDKAYYDYTSHDFQAATPLDQFRQFVQAYPVFLNNQSAHFTQRAIEHNIRTLKGKLISSDHVETPIEYKLIKEDKKWKILSIRLIKPANIQNAKAANHAEELIEVVKAQLNDIQEHKVGEAYQTYTSKEFREATSEEAFREFTRRYPLLAHHHVVSFHKPNIRNGIGTLSVIVQSEQLAAYVKYYLIFEDQEWKIWSMRILSPSEEQESQAEEEAKIKQKQLDQKDPMSFGFIRLSDQVDEQGQVQKSMTDFSSSLKDLYVDIEIKNGRKDNIVYLNLEHLESGSSIPAKATIEENGESMLMSVFSPPSNGWLTGHYKLIITTSSGLKSIENFEIH